ncbi:MAG: hypothetical protein H0U42_09360 [Thermoleophilaceae bacterium]|nr:hypothetical protein [Thermoleophilaceae bacterium]
MNNRGYTLLGWIVWKLGMRFGRRKLARSRVQLGALAVIIAVVVAGLAIAHGERD